jgi:hypothetical protein
LDDLSLRIAHLTTGLKSAAGGRVTGQRYNGCRGLSHRRETARGIVMEYLILFPIVFIYTAILWVAVLVVYNLLFEPFDFGALTDFAWKSAILVAIVSIIVTFVPFGGLASLIVWWIGLMIVFKKDFWECRILVILIWFVNFIFGLLIRGLVLSIANQSPTSSV